MPNELPSSLCEAAFWKSLPGAGAVGVKYSKSSRKGNLFGLVQQSGFQCIKLHILIFILNFDQLFSLYFHVSSIRNDKLQV